MDCGLKSNEELMVEVKDEEGNFEEYNPNLRYFRIWTWDNYLSQKEKEDVVVLSNSSNAN